MGSRLNLQILLETLIGSNNVYFQPPPTFLMSYPCIVYSRVNIRPRFANNNPYKLTTAYSLTVIDANPDSNIPNEVAKLPMCSFDRPFVSDNLNHYVFNLSY